MKTILSISTILIILVVAGCKEEVKVVALEPVVKIDSSKLTPGVAMLNREFNISYEYEGREALSKITRKVSIKLTILSYDTSNANMSILNLKVKNSSFEPFILDGEDIFIMNKEEILDNLKNSFYRTEILSGKELEFRITIPKPIVVNAGSIDIRKRSKDGLKTAFKINLK